MATVPANRSPLGVQVECHAGYRGEEAPRRFFLGGSAIDVTDVTDRWLAPDHRYFKVRDGRGDSYILRHEVASGCWELTAFTKGAPAEIKHASERPAR